MTDQPKFCRDCAHARPAEFYRWPKWSHLVPVFGWISCLVRYEFRDGFWEYAKCARGQYRYGPDLVSGARPKAELEYCSVMRNDEGDCGPSAKLFEPRAQAPPYQAMPLCAYDKRQKSHRTYGAHDVLQASSQARPSRRSSPRPRS